MLYLLHRITTYLTCMKCLDTLSNIYRNTPNHRPPPCHVKFIIKVGWALFRWVSRESFEKAEQMPTFLYISSTAAQEIHYTQNLNSCL